MNIIRSVLRTTVALDYNLNTKTLQRDIEFSIKVELKVLPCSLNAIYVRCSGFNPHYALENLVTMNGLSSSVATNKGSHQWITGTYWACNVPFPAKVSQNMSWLAELYPVFRSSSSCNPSGSNLDFSEAAYTISVSHSPATS